MSLTKNPAKCAICCKPVRGDPLVMSKTCEDHWKRDPSLGKYNETPILPIPTECLGLNKVRLWQASAAERMNTIWFETGRKYLEEYDDERRKRDQLHNQR